MPCGHQWAKINDLSVCYKCGIVQLYNGKIIFDRNFINENKRVKNRKNIKRVK